MASLPETANYDVGVYQLETTDPVQGGLLGVSNAPLKNLANRTAYLKQRVDNIEAGITDLPGYAKIASPTFTGDPKAPTPALGDNDTSIATTAFVQATVGGRLSKSVAGGSNVTLTAVEAGNAILEFTGALTANIAVIVPTSPTMSWIVKNSTSGAYTLTIKTAAGTGVVVTQGTVAIVFTDGTNVYDALTDFDSPVLTGNPTAPTPAQFDNDTSIATTAFVRSERGSLAGNSIYSVSGTIPVTDVGKRVISSAAGITLNLPLLSAVPVGSMIIVHAGAGGITLATSGTDTFVAGNQTPTTIAIKDGSCAWMMAAPNNWVMQSGDTLNAYSKFFDSLLTGSGYQKLPNGLIIQWGSVSNAATAGNATAVTFPIAFPTAALHVYQTVGSTATTVQSAWFDTLATTGFNSRANANSVNSRYLAIGY